MAAARGDGFAATISGADEFMVHSRFGLRREWQVLIVQRSWCARSASMAAVHDGMESAAAAGSLRECDTMMVLVHVKAAGVLAGGGRSVLSVNGGG